MLSAARRSLRAKIVLVVLLTTFAALAVSAVALLIYETRNYGAFLIDDATTQAELLADITAPALVFDDREAAEANLAIVSRRREIAAAAVYTRDGELFATFARSPNSVFPPLGSGTSVEGRTLTVFEPVVRNEELIGTVYLRSSYEIGGRVRDYLLILVGVMVPSFLVATVISLWLAGGVTGPLQSVTQAARQVVARRDFTQRATRTTDDEIGVLVDAFNTMVAEVGQRAAALEASNRALQQETEERRQAEVALRRADQLKDEFLATLAHELRNPLAPMVNAMALVESPAADAAGIQRAYAIIRRQLAHMVRLIDDLLDVSRITRGKLVIQRQVVDLAQVIENAADTVRPALQARHQTLAIDLPSTATRLHGDPVRLSQVFSNLLNNASKYSDHGKEIRVQATVADGMVTIRVVDEGMGISAEALPSVFEMFTQGTGQMAQSGLGVGLALARRLVDLHGGTLVAESAGPGRGSVFVATLPLATGEPTQQSSAADRAADRTTTARRILLVDDNVDFATSLGLLLEQRGHEIRIAHSAAQALSAAAELKPELAFLDLGLPDISGYELAATLRARPDTAATVLVAISGWGQPRDRERSRAAGFTLHLVKPVDLASLEAAIATLAARA